MAYVVKFLLIGFSLTIAQVSRAETALDYKTFVQHYFSTWKNTQMPGATAADLEAYLALLTDDIGYQHLPYASDDGRAPDNKSLMRKGMTYYLGSHTEFDAAITRYSIGENVIVLEYESAAKGVHPDNGQVHSYQSRAINVIELDGGKVSVIRHYDQ